MFKCGICGKEFNTVEERMEHERHCVAVHKEAEKQKKFEAKKKEIEYKKQLAKQDNERIQKEYECLVKHIKHHADIYNETVNLKNSSKGIDDLFFRPDVINPFFDLFI